MSVRLPELSGIAGRVGAGDTSPVNGEAGTRVDEAEPRDSRPVAGVRTHPTLAVAVSLIALAAVSAYLHSILVGWVHGPKVFMDELGYEQMAKSFARTGHFALFGKSGTGYAPLYPFLLSPIYALTASARTAYEWAKVENAALISLSVFPVYAIARFVLPRGRSVGVAALSLLAPLMLYTSFEMSESLAYPLFLIAIWAMLRAVRRPSVWNDVLLLAAIVLASGARLQQVALLPAALTAILLVAVLHPGPEPSRRRAVVEAIRRHWLLFGMFGASLVGGLAQTAVNGGSLPLAGRYSNVGSAHASVWRVLELAVEHLAELDFAVGVIPAAAALLCGYALVKLGFPRKPLVFASVAVATSVWLVLEVAFDAAAFDATSNNPQHGRVLDLPRIHERYLIYLVPLFLVALVKALPLLRRKIPTRVVLVLAAVAAALPLAIPFGAVINDTSAVDTFSLQAFARVENGGLAPTHHATLLILLVASLLAFGVVRAAAVPLPSLAVSMTVIAFLGMSALELNRQITPISAQKLGLPLQSDWVDRVVGRDSEVSLVSGPSTGRTLAADETAFWNASIARVYYTCNAAFGTDFGEQKLVAGDEITTRYAVVPAAFSVPGRVLARDPAGKFVLVAPTRDTLRIPGALRCGG